MTILNRETLKKNFEKGAIPTQQDFENLIDSMFNKTDDGIISQDYGLVISPQGGSPRLMTFFNSLNDFKPTWSIEQYPKNDENFGLNITDREGKSRLFLSPNGEMGIGTTEPAEKLTVAGNMSMHGRRGTYSHGEAPADGDWHNITPTLNAFHAFEIIAKVSKEGRGLHAMTYAIALTTFGRSNNKIQKIAAYYGSFRNKIDLRWIGDTFNYTLQIKTRRDYGEESMIKYYVTNLWWEDQELDN